jgi:hypothetical protein
MGKKAIKPQGGNVTVRVALDHYLASLEASETAKLPEKRRQVPSVAELAKAAGINRATLYNLIGNKTRSVNLDVLGAVVSELRQRGFEVDISDVIRIYPSHETSDAVSVQSVSAQH